MTSLEKVLLEYVSKRELTELEKLLIEQLKEAEKPKVKVSDYNPFTLTAPILNYTLCAKKDLNNDSGWTTTATRLR